jgi:homospermidine synthase
MHLPVEINCMTLLGLGTVGTGIIQIFPHFFKAKKLYVVDRIPDLEEKLRGIIGSALPEVQQALGKVEIIPLTIDISPETVCTEISALVAESQALMDLTTCVDSETMARLAESHHCAYICACIEVFDDDPLLSEGQRHQTWRELKKDLKTTMIIEMGMNPGLVSLLLNRALRDSGIAPTAVHTVHVTEYDSHRLREERRGPDQFYCTWSPYGLWQEGTHLISAFAFVTKRTHAGGNGLEP